MKKYKIKTWFNAGEFPSDNEKDFGPSLTDSAGYQTLDEIIERCQRGIPVNVAQMTPEYEFDGSANSEEILETVEPYVDGPDFDLADAPVVMSNLGKEQEMKEDKETTQESTQTNESTEENKKEESK